MNRLANPDRGPMTVFVFAVAVAVVVACVAIRMLLNAIGAAPVGQVLIGAVP